MDPKTHAALTALDLHEREFGTKVPDRIRNFYSIGEAWRYERWCMPPGTKIPMMEVGSFRLVVSLPSWIHLGQLGCDDAIVGPEGEWEAARNHIPLFVCEQSKFVVVRIDDGSVGWFEEECFDDTGDGYRDGVFTLATSLDAFLSTLVELDDATWETEEDEEIWESAFSEEE